MTMRRTYFIVITIAFVAAAILGITQVASVNGQAAQQPLFVASLSQNKAGAA